MDLISLNNFLASGIVISPVGMFSVIGLLIILIVLVAVFCTIIINGNKPKQAKLESGAFVAPSAQSVQDNDEIIAVIAAAVASMYDGTGTAAVIRSVRPSIRPNRSVWSAAGIYENTRAF